MTCEVVVMNRESIALAADSAMTVYDSHGVSYSEQIKLFEIARDPPVAAMVYGGGTFMGYPWRTVFDDYRRQNRGPFPEVRHYAADFLQFLESRAAALRPDNSSALVFDENHQREGLISFVFSLVARLKVAYEDAMAGQPPSRGQDTVLKSCAEGLYVRIRYEMSPDGEPKRAQNGALMERKPVRSDTRALEAFLGRHRREIVDAATGYFFGGWISGETKRLIEEAATLAILTDYFSPEIVTSGVVFGGFGRNQAFPAWCEVQLAGLFADVLKAQERAGRALGADGPAADIMPFAQANLVYTFLFGIDQRMDLLAEAQLYHATAYGVHKTLQAMGVNDDRRYADMATRVLQDFQGELLTDMRRDRRSVGWSQFLRPVLDHIASAPAGQTAEIAHKLVKLVVIEHRLLRRPTVADPIRVISITRDGMAVRDFDKGAGDA